MRPTVLFALLVSYGVRAPVGKALAGFLFLAMLAGPAAAEKVHIVAFGDSLTAGYGLPEHEGFVPQLRAWLEAQDEDVRVVNAGVSGDTTAGGQARFEWSLTAELQGVILILGGNDALRGIDPATMRANLDAILETAAERELEVLLVGMPGPGNYGPDYRAEFEAVYADLAEKHDTLFYPDFLAPLGDDPAEALDFMQADGIHPDAEGVARIVEAFGPSVQALIERIRSE
ncbi:MAG: acyl-CoA thioesterase I [Rhodobacteraceae bacterium HLUCCO07]|nr:MAG: acyl-CoA thioesterase I [Rhodobacteraceae bacterium HLUCCO07]